MPYREFDGPLDSNDKKPASGFVPFEGELDAPAPKPKRSWAQAAADTGAQLGEGVNNIIGAIPSLVAPESKVAGFFKGNADFWRDKQSAPLKERIAGADKAITAAGADGVVAQISEAASQYFSDPALAARFVTTNLPSMIPGIAAAKVAQAAALARGATAAKAAAVATTAAGGANAALNAGGARGEAFEDIKGTLIKQGMSPAEAEAQALKDSRLVAAIGGAAGFISGKTGLEGAIAGRVASGTAVRRGAGAFASELAGEQLEEVAPKLATNAQAGQYDNRALTQDVGRTMVETAIGAGPGAIVSGVSAARAQPEPALPPEPTPATPPEVRREPTWADTAAPAQPAAPAAPSIADIGAATSVDEAIAAAQAVVSAPVATPVATPYATPADIDALEASALATQAGGIADAVLPQDAALAADGRDQAATGTGAGIAGPTGTTGALPGAQPSPAAVDVQSVGPDLVRAGAGPDADAALTATPVRDAIDKVIDPASDWHAFPAETGTLNLPRADMPQIRAEHRGAMTQFLKARGIAHQEVEVPAESLKPTQAEFSLEKVNQALNYEGGERSILVSSDGHVLDGHHQWLAAVDAERPVRAIVLDAPIRDLIDTVREFPSAGLDTASATEAPAAAAPSRLEQARAKHQKQDDVIAKAMANNAARKATGGSRARERVQAENPFLHFLAATGISSQDRADSGAERGRAGNKMVPGFGPVYRKSGKRLDELALAAVEAGFLTQQDIEDAGDTGGTRKLADMIARALQNKEVIRPAGAVDAAQPSADDMLLAEAQKLGIATDGKSADQVYDAVVAAHAAQFTDEEAQLAADIFADIQMDGGTPSDNLTDEEIDAIFGIPTSARTTGREAEKTASEPAEKSDSRTGGAQQGPSAEIDGDLLASYTPAEIRARQDADEARAKARENERAKLDSQRKKDRDAADVRARMDDSADNFQLGQSADDSLSGQGDIFSQPAASTDPERDTGADIPRAFFKKVKVDHDVWIEDEGVMETVKERADVALKSVREDIANLKALIKCMKG